jgi:hypothetical protein
MYRNSSALLDFGNAKDDLVVLLKNHISGTRNTDKDRLMPFVTGSTESDQRNYGISSAEDANIALANMWTYIHVLNDDVFN